tara:strand:- start:618 stop:923 length:306 start_codon:yes stop_codon:yes gene_type:complete
MINNPLPDQIMNQNDDLYISDQFNEHCIDKAKEIANEFNLLPELIDDFSEYYIEVCKESDEGYSLTNDKSIIDEWFESIDSEYISPYKDYEPSDIDLLNHS